MRLHIVIVALSLLCANFRAEASNAGQATAAVDKHGAEAAEKIWSDLIAGNRRFVEGKAQVREVIKTREELVGGQQPKVIVLGCADSRVSPELVFDKNLGELFVVRTAGNIADKVALGSIEYAAEHLHCSVLLVLGHEKCGAVGAAASGEKMPSKNLEAIVERIEPALKRPRKAGLTGDMLVALGVETNLHQSVRDILKESEILRKAHASGELTIVKAVYKLATGEVARVSDESATAAEKK